MEYDYPTAIGQLDVVLDGWENLATEYDERLQWKILRGERPQHKERPGRWPNLPHPSVGATTACIVRKVPGERETIKNEEGETTGESGITSALSYYLTNKSTIMKKFLQISRTILSLSIITLISFSICAAVALAVLYIFGISDDTIRTCACIMFFGTILVALILGAFD